MIAHSFRPSISRAYPIDSFDTRLKSNACILVIIDFDQFFKLRIDFINFFEIYLKENRRRSH